jgi:hypothetical protein
LLKLTDAAVTNSLCGVSRLSPDSKLHWTVSTAAAALCHCFPDRFLVAVETFVAFLKGIESPFDVNDYVRSYLGASKDARDFAKQFLEKRSYYRNQEKQKDQVSICCMHCCFF